MSVLALLLATALADDALETVPLDVDAPDTIVLGQEESGYPTAVALGAFNFSACTGSVITPRIVLSAAHCGGDFSPETIAAIGSVYFGRSPGEATTTIGIEQWIPHPNYVPLGTGVPQTLPQNDVGIVVLEEDAPVDPVWFRSEPLGDAQIGEYVTSVGYGATSGDGSGSGVKRSAVLRVDAFQGQFLIANSSSADGSNICSGDSGGPQYHEGPDGRLMQWAVHSWGDQNCTVQSGSTRTDLVAEFLLEQVELVHGTRDFCEITSRYGDGICDDWCDTVDPDCLEDEEDSEAKGCGCTTTAAPTGWLALAPLLVALGRRRR